VKALRKGETAPGNTGSPSIFRKSSSRTTRQCTYNSNCNSNWTKTQASSLRA